MASRWISRAAAMVVAFLISYPAYAQVYTDADRRMEFALVDSMASEMLPRICELAGFELGEPVPIEIWTRSELRAARFSGLRRCNSLCSVP